jgi:hypothetical protein
MLEEERQMMAKEMSGNMLSTIGTLFSGKKPGPGNSPADKISNPKND